MTDRNKIHGATHIEWMAVGWVLAEEKPMTLEQAAEQVLDAVDHCTCEECIATAKAALQSFAVEVAREMQERAATAIRSEHYPDKPESEWTRRDGTRAHYALAGSRAIRALSAEAIVKEMGKP